MCVCVSGSQEHVPYPAWFLSALQERQADTRRVRSTELTAELDTLSLKKTPLKLIIARTSNERGTFAVQTDTGLCW